MSHSYPSDISREQFARILPTLESARRRTKPRTVDLYDVFCGVLYLLKSGCQWRMLPADFPDWRTCYKYFRQWSERPGPEQESLLEQVLKKIGWRGPAGQWPERADQLLHRRCPEREEHRQRREQGL
jgi:transposase